MEIVFLVSQSTSMLIGGLWALLSLAPSGRPAAQATPVAAGTLTVRGDVQMQLSLSPDELKAMRRRWQTLLAYQGPLRIVAPRDTRPARSIRMVERLEVVQLKK